MQKEPKWWWRPASWVVRRVFGALRKLIRYAFSAEIDSRKANPWVVLLQWVASVTYTIGITFGLSQGLFGVGTVGIALGIIINLIFLGRDLAMHKNFSEKTAELIDIEEKKIITRNFDRAKELSEKNRASLQKIAEELLDKEVLSSEEIDNIIEGNNKKPVKKPRKKAESKKEKPKAGPAEA